MIACTLAALLQCSTADVRLSQTDARALRVLGIDALAAPRHEMREMYLHDCIREGTMSSDRSSSSSNNRSFTNWSTGRRLAWR